MSMSQAGSDSVLTAGMALRVGTFVARPAGWLIDFNNAIENYHNGINISDFTRLANRITNDTDDSMPSMIED